jgi:hypothetical protein
MGPTPAFTSFDATPQALWYLTPAVVVAIVGDIKLLLPLHPAAPCPP